MTKEMQPEALRLAEFFESMKKSSHRWYDGTPVHEKAAAELRRLHARVQELEAAQAQKGDYLDGVNIPRLREALTFLGRGNGVGEGEVAGKLSEYVNSIVRAVLACKELLRSGAVQDQRKPLTDEQAKRIGKETFIAVLDDLEDDLHVAVVRRTERDHAEEDASIAAGRLQAGIAGRVA